MRGPRPRRDVRPGVFSAASVASAVSLVLTHPGDLTVNRSPIGWWGSPPVVPGAFRGPSGALRAGAHLPFCTPTTLGRFADNDGVLLPPVASRQRFQPASFLPT